MELANTTARQHPARFDRSRHIGEVAGRIGNLQRHDYSALRRQQQLVRGLRLLATEVLRAPECEADQRRPQEVAPREAPAHPKCSKSDTGDPPAYPPGRGSAPPSECRTPRCSTQETQP